ncbi:uncharacterized protein LOC114036533 [Vombatus ursinus]|uniref:uncharacterized protein LOC114036533 n=1 Tax=Vombatus ursinus TaxID=29139 RepID=UPI000FFD3125|nr:uncharacterized protein LOC114036533 [Vombatus ursinus]
MPTGIKRQANQPYYCHVHHSLSDPDEGSPRVLGTVGAPPHKTASSPAPKATIEGRNHCREGGLPVSSPTGTTTPKREIDTEAPGLAASPRPQVLLPTQVSQPSSKEQLLWRRGQPSPPAASQWPYTSRQASLTEAARPPREGQTSQTPTLLATISLETLMEAAQHKSFGKSKASSSEPSAVLLEAAPMEMQPGPAPAGAAATATEDPEKTSRHQSHQHSQMAQRQKLL